jgi:hypothetical protein
MIMAFYITIITRCGLNELCFVYVLTTRTGYLVFAPFASGLVRSCSHILHRPHDHCPFSTTPPPFMRFYSIPQSARVSLQCARRRSLSLGLTPSFSLLSNPCFNLTSTHSPHLLCLQQLVYVFLCVNLLSAVPHRHGGSPLLSAQCSRYRFSGSSPFLCSFISLRPSFGNPRLLSCYPHRLPNIAHHLSLGSLWVSFFTS